jgi:hypothetical protein
MAENENPAAVGTADGADHVIAGCESAIHNTTTASNQSTATENLAGGNIRYFKSGDRRGQGGAA